MSERLFYEILEFISVLIEVFIVHQYISVFFDRDSHQSRRMLIGFAIFTVGLSILSLTYREPMVLAGFTLVGVFALEYFFYEGSISSKLISSLFFAILMIGSDIVCAGVLLLNRGTSLVDTQQFGLQRTLGIVISKIVQILIVKISGIIVKWKNNSNNKLEIKRILPLLVCQIFCILISHTIFISAFRDRNSMDLTVFLSILGVMYINIIVFWYFDNIKATYDYKHQKNLIETKLEFQKKYYELLEEHQRETESLWHDMKKHMSAIKELYDGNLKSESFQYIYSLEEKINAIPKVIRTANPIIDALIMNELRKAKKDNIEVFLDVNISNSIKMEAIDLCVILGNTLENAIDACRVLPNGTPRTIEVQILQDESILLLSLKNPYDPNSAAVSKEARTHGYGLKNVYKVIKKYGGDIEVTSTRNTYQVSMIIP